jgi:hypothetical protein
MKKWRQKSSCAAIFGNTEVKNRCRKSRCIAIGILTLRIKSEMNFAYRPTAPNPWLFLLAPAGFPASAVPHLKLSANK